MSAEVIVKARTTKRLRDAFYRVAKANGRSVEEELRRVIQRHVDEQAATR